jgi:hypothetical protein
MNQQYLKVLDLYAFSRDLVAEALPHCVRITTRNTEPKMCGYTEISYADARKLVEMLVKHTHPGQTLEPSKPAKPPQLILAWEHPANGHRFSRVSNEAKATDWAVGLKQGLPDFPIWLAQITKQYVQPNPTYEWKDI